MQRRAWSLPVVLLLCLTSGCPRSSPPPPSSLTESSAAPLVSATPSASATTVGPERIACTSRFGHALDRHFGRLDGTLVAIVPPRQRGCHSDGSHLHLQVRVDGEIYDVAVNLRGLTAETPHALAGGAFAEGWHDDAKLEYARDLDVHAKSFVETDEAKLEAELANVDRISIFATGYGGGGAHLVHRNGHADDGALVLHPLEPTPTYVLFRFAQQSF